MTQPTLGTQFVKQLQALMDKLNATKPHFIKYATTVDRSAPSLEPPAMHSEASQNYSCLEWLKG